MAKLLIITVLLFALELIYFKIGDHFNIIDKPNQRSSHTSITLRGGGLFSYLEFGYMLPSLDFNILGFF